MNEAHLYLSLSPSPSLSLVAFAVDASVQQSMKMQQETPEWGEEKSGKLR